MADSVVTHDEEDFLVHGNPNVNPKWNRMSVTSWRSMYILGDLVNNCNLELEMAAEWFQANRLTLNAKKTKCMVFGPNGNSVPLPKNLNIAGETIERIVDRLPTKHFKFVGVLLDDNINWNEQFKLVKNNVAKVSYNLARAKRCIPEHIKLLI